MKHSSIKVLVIAFLALLCGIAVRAQNPSSHDRGSWVVLTFKDGHQKSFASSELSRIEFDPPRIVLKNGHTESFSKDEIVRIEMKSSADNGVLGRNHFVGKWKVGDGAGSHFFITLDRDGVATKTIGASHGTWELVNGEARISWDDGWHDAIRKAGDKHEKCAFEPGKSFNDEPSNVTDAQNTTAQPI
jgi:hypothetical protein